MRRTLIALAALLFSVSAFAQTSSLTTVILVRHGEKVAPTGDPVLSAAGIARAEELARVLSDTQIAAVYATNYQRTQLTAAPVAKAHALTPVVLTADDKYVTNVLGRVREHAGGTIVVVGHSNTTADVIRALGVKDFGAIADSEYDNLFVVTTDGKNATLTRLRFGAPAH